MMLRAATAALLLIGVACVQAQDGGTAPRQVVISKEPVTRDEARTVLTRIEKALRGVAPGMKETQSKLSGAQPITRAEVAHEFDRIFQAAKPAFKISPKREAVPANAIRMSDAAAKTKMETLMGWGLVQPQTPIAVSQKETLSVIEFGHAVGVFLGRMAELTHTPSLKYSPDLMR